MAHGEMKVTRTMREGERCMSSLFMRLYFLLLCLTFLLTGFLSFSDSYEWKILRDTDGKEDIPIVFKVKNAGTGSDNQVHQIEIRFQPNQTQLTGGTGSGELWFDVFVPNQAYDDYIELPIENPVVSDDGNDLVPDYTHDTNSECGCSNSYYITVEKIDGSNEWKLEILFTPASSPFGVIGYSPHNGAPADGIQFVIIAKNVRIPDPQTGEKLSKVNMTIGTRTRAEYPSGSLGNTGLTFDAPPSITVTTTGSPIIYNEYYVYEVAFGTVDPFASDSFTSSVQNMDGIVNNAGELSGAQWTIDPNGPDTSQVISGYTANSLSFHHLALHDLFFTIEENVFGSIKQKAIKYIPVVVKDPPAAHFDYSIDGGSTFNPAPVGTLPFARGNTISLDAAGSTDNDPLSGGLTYAWDFNGDGAADATGASSSHLFGADGFYGIKLTVTDKYGAHNDTFMNVFVSASGTAAPDFPKPVLVFPANGAVNVPANVTLQWQPVAETADTGAIHYHLYLSKDSAFASCTPILADSWFLGMGAVALAGVLSCVPAARGGKREKRRRAILFCVLAILLSMLFVSCPTDTGAGGTPGTSAQTLQSGATYYWKVRAENAQGACGESEVWSFTTE